MNNKFYNLLAHKVRPIELANIIKRSMMIKRRVSESREGAVFYIDPVSNFGNSILNEGEYEVETTKILLSNIQENDVFIDLGANEGYFSVLASLKVGVKGKVISIEPQQRLWEVLIKNFNLNECLNVQLVPNGMGNEIAELEIVKTPSINTGSSSFVKTSRNNAWQRDKVKILTLDYIAEKLQLSRVDLIKIDIEGFEYFALQGAANMLKNRVIKKIFIEIHPEQLKALGVSANAVEDLLMGYGYSKSSEFDGLFELL